MNWDEKCWHHGEKYTYRGPWLNTLASITLHRGTFERRQKNANWRSHNTGARASLVVIYCYEVHILLCKTLSTPAPSTSDCDLLKYWILGQKSTDTCVIIVEANNHCHSPLEQSLSASSIRPLLGISCTSGPELPSLRDL